MRTKVSLPPYPDGWYAVGLSKEIPSGVLVNRRIGDEEIVLFRTESGVLNAIEAYCPHLGAHLGHGGTVEGEDIKCPFHGFCFNGSGDCTKTGYGTKPPPTAKSKTWQVRDKNGFVMLYYSSLHETPLWEIPDVSADGWNAVLTKSFDINSHPQETTENSVDIGHFSEVHGYTGIEELKAMTTDGPYLTTKYAMHRHAGFVGSKEKIRAQFEVHVHGLGYSFVEAEAPKYGLEYRTFVLPTPIGDGKLRLTLGLQLKKIKNAYKVNPVLALLPKSLVNMIIGKASFNGFLNDVKEDFHIWENKTFIAPPALAKGDGPIGKYRTWAKQFYRETTKLSSEKTA
ncbi:MAG: phenylpropionate dioxygenase-like ring-hydroxylating dioxygenase large terminal subunit [Candidatus Latescibacterota bacterium]|jgi:phenylpropionate dioxygenase-like ring-hydroxylating dioxygenase large terminal subunit